METELRRGYSGTAKRKGRQQTNQTYCHRATFLLYLAKVSRTTANLKGAEGKTLADEVMPRLTSA